MSELAIHEPRSFKVCQQLCIESKEVRKGAKNERKAGGVGIQSEESVGGARKQAGMQREQERETERQGEQVERRQTRVGNQEGMRQIERRVGRQEGELSVK